jgi:hypothetical protein
VLYEDSVLLCGVLGSVTIETLPTSTGPAGNDHPSHMSPRGDSESYHLLLLGTGQAVCCYGVMG